MPLMTYEEYSKIEHEHAIPYKFVLNFNSNFLYFFGEEHSYSPNNSQWVTEKDFWQDFLEKTNGQKRIAFVEGGKPRVELTEQEAIIKSGGGEFITYIAHQENIETYCPEPTILKDIFKTDFDEGDVEFFKNITTPVETKTIINQVARECSNIRDTHIVKETIGYLNNGYSIYVQYGCTHAVRQEPLLRELI